MHCDAYTHVRVLGHQNNTRDKKGDNMRDNKGDNMRYNKGDNNRDNEGVNPAGPGDCCQRSFL
jgi:hypothetical protein